MPRPDLLLSRLTPEDEAVIRSAMRGRLADLPDLAPEPELVPGLLLVLVGLRAIGCTPSDMRDAELLLVSDWARQELDA